MLLGPTYNYHGFRGSFEVCVHVDRHKSYKGGVISVLDYCVVRVCVEAILCTECKVKDNANLTDVGCLTVILLE